MPLFKKRIDIGTKIIVPQVFLMVVIFGVVYAWFYNSQKSIIKDESGDVMLRAEEEFNDLEDRDIKALNSVLNVLVEDETIKEKYLKKDRDELYDHVRERFLKNKDLYGITHWYFIGLDDRVFLRIHNKDIFGDVVKRETYEKAKETNLASGGIELGKTAFALRVVLPYYYQDELIGYMELGQEIDHFLGDVKEDTKGALAVVVRKESLDEESWKLASEVSGRRNNWDDNENYVFISTNAEDGSKERTALEHFLTPQNFLHVQETKEEYILGEHEIDKENFSVGEFHLRDPSGDEVGAVFVAFNNTGLYQTVNSEIAKLSFYWLLIFSFFLLFFSFFVKKNILNPLKKIEESFAKIISSDYTGKLKIASRDEFGRLSEIFNKMTRAIRKSRKEITKKVFEQTKHIEEQKKNLEKQQTAMVNVLEDVQLEKENAQKLAAELEKFKLAVDDASDHIAITDEDGNILYGNKAVEKITGYSLREIVGKKAGTKKNWGGNMGPKFYEKLWNTIKKEKKVFIGEVKNKRKGGDFYIAETSISPVIEDGKVKFFVAIERDITKEKQIDQAKTEFVSLASHQLRTPLTSIKWYTEMLLSGDAGKVSDKQKEFIEEISQGNDRMVDLVNALLNVSRIELGTFTVDVEPTNTVEITESLLGELGPSIKEKNIKVVKKYDKSLPIIKADPKLLRIVIQNLLSNAVKYTPEKGEVSLEITKDKKDMLLKFSDTGYGIPKHQQDKIFSKLFRADNVMKKEVEGNGLGLYIVKAIVDNAKGKIWFESKEDKGTTFFVKIPLSGMKSKKGTRKLG